MEAILNFLVDNYLWFLIISLILVFALIGYIVDSREKKTPTLHFKENEDVVLETDNLPKDKSLNEMLKSGNENVESLEEQVIDEPITNDTLKTTEEPEIPNE